MFEGNEEISRFPIFFPLKCSFMRFDSERRLLKRHFYYMCVRVGFSLNAYTDELKLWQFRPIYYPAVLLVLSKKKGWNPSPGGLCLQKYFSIKSCAAKVPFSNPFPSFIVHQDLQLSQKKPFSVITNFVTTTGIATFQD